MEQQIHNTQYPELSPEEKERQQKCKQMKADIKALATQQTLVKGWRKPEHFLQSVELAAKLNLSSTSTAQAQVELNRVALRHMYVVYAYIRNGSWAPNALGIMQQPDSKTGPIWRKAIFDKYLQQYGTDTVRFNP